MEEECFQIHFNFIKLGLEVTDHMLILRFCLVQTIPYQGADFFPTSYRIESVKNHHCPKKNHAQKMAPHIHRLIVELK
jgi:hypothetical protein